MKHDQYDTHSVRRRLDSDSAIEVFRTIMVGFACVACAFIVSMIVYGIVDELRKSLVLHETLIGVAGAVGAVALLWLIGRTVLRYVDR